MEMENKNTIKEFQDIQNFDKCLIKALSNLGYTKPSEVQKITIPLGIANNNLIAQSKAGTGKTLAFLSIMLQNLIVNFSKGNKIRIAIENKECQQIQNKDNQGFQCVILLPTRELSLQVYEVLIKLIRELENTELKLSIKLKPGIFIGGLPIEDDRKNLKANTFNIAIGTLGRITALFQEKSLNFQNVKVLILDEADKLLQKKALLKQIEDIIKQINDSQYKQALFYSATFPQQQLETIKQLLNQNFQANPYKFVEIQSIQNQNSTLQKQNTHTYSQQNNQNDMQENKILGFDQENENDTDNNSDKIRFNNLIQIVQKIENNSQTYKSIYKLKIEKIIEVLSQLKFEQCVIFYNDKPRGETLYNDLKAEGYVPIFIHGDQNQAERIRVMNQLKRKKVNIIIATDLLSRGIDIQTIDLVINFDAPINIETYYHRIGRTARYGKFGVSVFLISEKEEWFMKQNEHKLINMVENYDINNINDKLQRKQTDLLQKKEVTPLSQRISALPSQISDWKETNESLYDSTAFRYKQNNQTVKITKDLKDNLLSEYMQEDGDENSEINEVEIEDEEEDYSIMEKTNNEQERKQNLICKNTIESSIQSQSQHFSHLNQLEFLKCKICYEFIIKTQQITNKKFKILEYFNLD